MHISMARNGQAVDVFVDGQLDAGNRMELKQAVLGEFERGARLFRIDFAQTGYIDSAGLGALVALSKHIRDRDGEFRLRHLNPDLQSLFHLTKLDLLFRIDDDDDPAGRIAQTGIRERDSRHTFEERAHDDRAVDGR